VGPLSKDCAVVINPGMDPLSTWSCRFGGCGVGKRGHDGLNSLDYKAKTKHKEECRKKKPQALEVQAPDGRITSTLFKSERGGVPHKGDYTRVNPQSVGFQHRALGGSRKKKTSASSLGNVQIPEKRWVQHGRVDRVELGKNKVER